MKSPHRPTAVTMDDVAARAGVSRALVSIVFRGAPGASQASRERVMAAAEELAYRPDRRASLLGRSHSRTIGVVFGLHREFHAELVEQLYRACEPTEYDLALGATAPSRDESAAIGSLLDFRCEAMVLVGPTLRIAHIEELAARLPVVVLARSLRARAVDVVRTDDVAGARLAVQHLAALGHRGIVHVDGHRAPGAAERRRGYRSAMADLGLDSRAVIVRGGLTDEDGERAAPAVLGLEDVTAVSAFNDHCAAGLLASLRQQGTRVPEDLSLVGYDDSHVAGLAGIALTTVAQDPAELATAALDLAVRRAQDSDAPDPGARREGISRGSDEVVIAPRLVERRTTGPPAENRQP